MTIGNLKANKISRATKATEVHHRTLTEILLLAAVNVRRSFLVMIASSNIWKNNII